MLAERRQMQQLDPPVRRVAAFADPTTTELEGPLMLMSV